jgi:hypothetical protein
MVQVDKVDPVDADPLQYRCSIRKVEVEESEVYLAARRSVATMVMQIYD